MGVTGGVSGLVVSNKWGDIDRYVHEVELAVAAVVALNYGGTDALVKFAVLFIVPLLWFGFFLDRCGVGSVWRFFLRDRQFDVADAVSRDADSDKFPRRHVYTRNIE